MAVDVGGDRSVQWKVEVGHVRKKPQSKKKGSKG
jgi:hypothetical protein